LEKEGNETELLEIINTKDLQQALDLVKKKKIDIIVIEPFLNFKVALRLAKKLKNFVKRILAIGPVASVIPEKFVFKKSPVEFCIIGEPELTLLKVIKRLENGKSVKCIKGIAFFDYSKNKLVKTGFGEFVNNLDKLPFPKHSFFLNNQKYNFYYPVNIRKKIKMGYILASRGCPYNCLFCSPIERVSYGKKLRVRSATNIADEMQFLESQGVNVVYFRDDCFNANKKWVVDVCDEIIKRKIKIKWVANCRPDNFDKRVLIKMKKAGCSTVCLGIESGSDRILSMLNKGITVKKVQKVIKLINEIGIWVVGFFIIGNPSETKEEMEQTFKLAKRLQPEMIQLHFFTPYPGSPAFKLYSYKIKSSKFLPSNSLSQMNIEELERYQRYFYRKYYFSPRFIKKYISKQFIPLVRNFFMYKNLIKKTLNFLL
jgi:radical SAM superfamily enzyme YgiQ (UPF0313 family)